MYKVMYRMLFYMPWLIMSLAIIYFSHQESIEFLNGTFYLQDKVLHFNAYLIYGFTIQLAIINSNNYRTRKYIYTIILIGAIFGLSDEIHQYFVIGRSTEFLDWVADVLGVSFSLIFKNIILWFKNKVDMSFN